MKGDGVSVSKTCGKIRYDDKIAAMLALAQCKHAKKGRRRETRIYWCPICGGYHLTKQEKKLIDAKQL